MYRTYKHSSQQMHPLVENREYGSRSQEIQLKMESLKSMLKHRLKLKILRKLRAKLVIIVLY